MAVLLGGRRTIRAKEKSAAVWAGSQISRSDDQVEGWAIVPQRGGSRPGGLAVLTGLLCQMQEVSPRSGPASRRVVHASPFSRGWKECYPARLLVDSRMTSSGWMAISRGSSFLVSMRSRRVWAAIVPIRIRGWRTVVRLGVL